MPQATIAAYDVICAAGWGKQAAADTVFSGTLPPLTPWPLADGGRTVPVFRLDLDAPLPDHLRAWDCRNNRLAWHLVRRIADAVDAARTAVGSHRLAVVLGSSTSGIAATEHHLIPQVAGPSPAPFDYARQHEMGALAHFVAHVCGAAGPSYTISTACSSAAKAMAAAAGLLAADLCDAVITGGVDTLCHLTVNGFSALGQTSPERTIPLSAHRTGLNIGEGGALFLLTRDEGPLRLLGAGESADAYHMSAPDPSGAGARLAMERALDDAAVAPDQVAYVNLHATGTAANDAMETAAFAQVFDPDRTWCGGTKMYTGHCLGAAGAVEAALCCASLCDPRGRMPRHAFDGCLDPAFPPLRVADATARFGSETRRVAASNSFAFGGNNCSLVLAYEVSP